MEKQLHMGFRKEKQFRNHRMGCHNRHMELVQEHSKGLELARSKELEQVCSKELELVRSKELLRSMAQAHHSTS